MLWIFTILSYSFYGESVLIFLLKISGPYWMFYGYDGAFFYFFHALPQDEKSSKCLLYPSRAH